MSSGSPGSSNSPGTSGSSGSLFSPAVRSPEEDEVIFEKSTKIKLWVKTRMQELEDQNERLRLQNLRCTTQLQMLRSFTEKNRQLKQEMAMSRSITGTLPVMRDTENRTSDDSGLTSDDTSDRRQMSASMAETTPRIQRKPVRIRKDSTGVEDKRSSTSDCSPWDEQYKPIPTPRKLTGTNNNTLIERDSLNSSVDDYEFDVEDEEIFDEIDEATDHDGNPPNKHSEYVNLADFVAIRDDKNHYAAIIKHSDREPPALPNHRPKDWEMKLFQAADSCLNMEFKDGEQPSSSSPCHVGRLSMSNRTGSPSSLCFSPNIRSSPRGSSIRTVSGAGCASPLASNSEGHYAVRDLALPQGSEYSDYYVPPDAQPATFRSSMVQGSEMIEKSGYWMHATENSNSMKKRYVVLKENVLRFYKHSRSASKNESPSLEIQLNNVKSVSTIEQQGTEYAFQLQTSTKKYKFMTDSEQSTQEWVDILSSAIKGFVMNELVLRRGPLEADIHGWLTRVRCGISKKMYTAVCGQRLMFFKNTEDALPSCFTNLQGASICDKGRSSAEESSSGSDETEPSFPLPIRDKKKELSISIQIASNDPIYLVFPSCEEREKWLYYLRLASGDLFGTPFEVLLRRMLTERDGPGDTLWDDMLLTAVDDTPKELLTTVPEAEKKKTLELAKMVHLFVSVLMRPAAVQYHIDLAQNIFKMALQSDYMRHELFAQLITLTNGSMPFGIQGWKLLALALPIFLPKNYGIFWLLQGHISRWRHKGVEIGALAGYCQSAMERCQLVGGRAEGPSRLEASCVLVRDPTATNFPHSIPVRLPNGQYQVVEFDGSTEIGQCMSSLTVKLGMRPALLSGYALYIEDPITKGVELLKGKQKLCDSLSIWEQRVWDTQRGKVSSECAATLILRLRHYWKHLVCGEKPIEKSFLVWRMAEELRASRMPISPLLAEKLAALYAQMVYGDAPLAMADDQFEYIVKMFYPTKLYEVACIGALRSSILVHWSELCGTSESDSIRMIIQVLRKWPLFGCDLHEAGHKMKNNLPVYLALTEQAIYVLDQRHFSVLLTVPYNRVLGYGELCNDFMLLVKRVLPPGATVNPDETPKDRHTFSMPHKATIEQMSLHLREYIRCQKLVLKIST